MSEAKLVLTDELVTEALRRGRLPSGMQRQQETRNDIRGIDRASRGCRKPKENELWRQRQ